MTGLTDGQDEPAPIPVFDVRIEDEDVESVLETLRTGWWSMGPRVAQFESEFSASMGGAHVVATSSCTTALHLAMLCAGVGPGDEVVLPSFTFVATGATVLQAGGTPVFADVVSQDDLGIDPIDVERRIGERTKAVIAVHYAGYPAAVDRLRSICDERGVALIEDCAHAPSANLGGRQIGTFGLAGCFSFFSNKVLACGEGGALVTEREDVADRARLLRSQGMTAGTMDRHTGRAMGYDVVETGFNYRMDELKAALLLPRFRRLEREIERRRELVSAYRQKLAHLEGLSIAYAETPLETSSCYVMASMIANGEREGVRERLNQRGVRTTVHYARGVHELRAYRERYPEVSLPQTEAASRSQLCLPLYPHMTADEQDRVVESLAEALQ